MKDLKIWLAFGAILLVGSLLGSDAKASETPDNNSQHTDNNDTMTQAEIDKQLSIDLRGNKKQPISFRNNNPGNLVASSIPWQGKAESNGSHFEVFKTFAYGTRAMIKDISNKISGKGGKKKKFDTISKLIEEWAPRARNGGDNTDLAVDNYIAAVTKETEITSTDIITNDKQTLKKIVVAMSRHEAGKLSVTPEMFEAAYTLL
jgi:hypothetical protein